MAPAPLSRTHLDGGGANMRIGLTYTTLLVMFFTFQVCSISPYPHSSVYKFLGSAVAIIPYPFAI